MTGDIPSGVMSLLDVADRPSGHTPLRDDGKALFAEDAYDLRQATADEAERGGLMRHPGLRPVRLSRIEDGAATALVFNIEAYHVMAINLASDDFYEACWDALIERGFQAFTVEAA